MAAAARAAGACWRRRLRPHLHIHPGSTRPPNAAPLETISITTFSPARLGAARRLRLAGYFEPPTPAPPRQSISETTRRPHHAPPHGRLGRRLCSRRTYTHTSKRRYPVGVYYPMQLKRSTSRNYIVSLDFSHVVGSLIRIFC
ncbi:hypothetical protein R5R35_003643 [Gryllus longicercus]|uniref:Uncharacterized protein n=1 Tax=Gryllus longicercus TaxID=2509291 RepID=A0AAN9VYL6_9ORTH